MLNPIALVCAVLCTPGLQSGEREPAPALKVYILAGQSNMQGHAAHSTIPAMGADPQTAALLAEMRLPDGSLRSAERVWISSVGCAGDGWSDVIEQHGLLTAGFGASEEEIGPEYTLGLTLEKRHEGPILLIKTAWGGRSLHTDFRPPSAGPYAWSEFELARIAERGDNLAEIQAAKLKETGQFYREMLKHVRLVLGDIPRVVPGYEPEQGYEIAGFVWFQGFNDYVSDWTYERQMEPDGYSLYTELLGHLIRDVRRDLGVPKLPWVIGTLGVGGIAAGQQPPMLGFRRAQQAVAELPDFKGNVLVVNTERFWDPELEALRERWEALHYELDQQEEQQPSATPEAREAARERAISKRFSAAELSRLEGSSDGGYHYLGAAKILAPIGQAFAEALEALAPR
jgi:alpha-galactosidase